MVRPADAAQAVARMVELRGVQRGFPLYGTLDAARTGSRTRTRCCATTARWSGPSC